jgi:hypothetical protein
MYLGEQKMSIKLTPQDVELFQNSAKRIGEISEQIRTRLSQILRLISNRIDLPFDGHVYVDAESDYTFGFCDVDAFENPNDSDLYFSAHFTISRKVPNLEAQAKLIALGHLTSSIPFKWLNWTDIRIEKELPKVFGRNTKLWLLQAEMRLIKTKILTLCEGHSYPKVNLINSLVPTHKLSLVKKCIAELILFRNIKEENKVLTFEHKY